MTTTPCTGCAVQQGTHQPAEALHKIAEPDAQHLQELAAYRFTVENLRARVAELEAQLAESTHPTQQGLEQDAARWRMVALISKEVMIHPDKRTAADAVSAYMHAVHSGLDIQGAIDAALAAQAKQGEQANG